MIKKLADFIRARKMRRLATRAAYHREEAERHVDMAEMHTLAADLIERDTEELRLERELQDSGLPEVTEVCSEEYVEARLGQVAEIYQEKVAR